MSSATLLDVFTPPDGLVGHSAALVAMSGAEDFLEEAVLRFTGLGARQRSELASVQVYLMLDGHASESRRSVLPPGRIPALHELQPRAQPAGALLHAKLALLAFAPSRSAAPALLRLGVLTANFTYASARQHLELCWVVDVALDGSAIPDDRADVCAAGAFVEKLLASRFHRDEQLLPPAERKLTARLDALLRAAASLATKRKPRFIHSLDRPLYEQIRERLRAAVDKPRNLLLCGSGFYEEPRNEGHKPLVLRKLEELGVFSESVRRVALVEPSEAGALATWAHAGDTDGWSLVRPCDALARDARGQRRLHAKFVYVGYLRDGHASHGMLYLGSGNLSRRGLLSHGGLPEGNVEAGVVLEVPERLSPERLEQALFWAQDHAEDVAPEAWAVGQVGDGPDEYPLLRAPPILSAHIDASSSPTLRLLWRDDADRSGVSIAWTGRDWLAVQEDTAPLSVHDQPVALQVRDARGEQWMVPVVDAAGRVGFQPTRFDSYEDALAALLDFPIRPVEAASDDDERDGDAGRGGGAPGRSDEAEHAKSYALHAAAELLERVAALQATLPPSLLDDWLDHLDRTLRSAFPEALIAGWRAAGLDVFAELAEPELSPPGLSATQRARYAHVLAQAAHAWGLR